MEQQKESLESIVKRAPKEATHYAYPEDFSNEVFWKIEGDTVKSAWVPLSCFSDTESYWYYEDSGYWRTDYADYEHPCVWWFNLVELPKYADKWEPKVGEIVLFKRTDSIDFAYDSPERMEVVTIVGDKVWLKNALRDLVTDLDNISPLKKSFREKLVVLLSRGEECDYVRVDDAVNRLIEAGVKLEGM